MDTLNLAIFHFINNAAGYYHDLDLFMVFLTTYLSYAIVSMVVLYVGVYLPIRRSAPIDRLRSLAQGGELVFVLAATWFVVQTIKVLTAHPRPFAALTDIIVLLPQQTGYSFPSAHAAITVAVATTISFTHRRLGLLLYAFAFVVGMSRIYTGVHYPIDVLVGILLGIIIPYLIHMVFAQMAKYKVQL
jgi:undecaprenyl-diphosphatase